MVQKYSAALIAVAITLVAALAQLTTTVSITDAIQLVLLGLNAVLIYVVPLFGPGAQSTWKTTIAVVVAVLTALVPFWTSDGITGAQIAIVVLAGLQALGAHVGVQLRKNDLTTAA